MLRVLDLPTHVTLLQLDVARLGARLERHPLVRTVTIRRQFPETLQISVQERTPYLTVAAGADRVVVDADGVVLRPVQLGRDRHLPQLQLDGERALAAGMRLRQADIQRALELLQTYYASSVAATMRVASLVVEKSGASRWRFESYPFPIHFGEGRIGAQLERLPPVLRYIRERGIAVRVLDLSYQKRAIVTPAS
jgi:cell division septal protein FtsQ